MAITDLCGSLILAIFCVFAAGFPCREFFLEFFFIILRIQTYNYFRRHYNGIAIKNNFLFLYNAHVIVVSLSDWTNLGKFIGASGHVSQYQDGHNTFNASR